MSAEQKDAVEIETPNTDRRNFRYFELDNGIKCIVYSDPEGDKEGAAVCCRVGSYSDPKELPGLAHFCEHMLFMGSKEFPGENEYSEYLNKHGGGSNAFTASEETNYFFDISKGGHLSHALELLSGFFKNPLFNEDSTDRELKAVDSENAKNFQNDMWRAYQLDKNLSDPNHPYNRFATGNKETLDTTPSKKGIKVRDELLKFHKKFYSANTMSLVVGTANGDLDETQALVTKLFKDVENKKIDPPIAKGTPWTEKYLMRQITWVPVKNKRQMVMKWHIPALKKVYKKKTGSVMSHLLGHEGEGSLFTLMRSKGWANSLSAWSEKSNEDWSMMNVALDLTEEGLKHTDELVQMTFQYIEKMKAGFKAKEMELHVKECQMTNRIGFHFKSKTPPYSECQRLASAIHKYAPAEVMSGPYLLKEIDLEHLEKITNCLTVDNLNIALSGQEFEDECKDSEQWYGTKYDVRQFTAKQIEMWRKCGENKDLHLPKKNEFLPENLDVLIPRDKAPEKEEDKAVPKLVLKDKNMEVYHKTDDRFHKPKMRGYFYFNMPAKKECTAKESILSSLYGRYIKFLMNEYAYDAEVAGLSFSIGATFAEVQISVGGYNDKAHVLLEALLKKVVEAPGLFEKERFEILRRKVELDLENATKGEPYRQIGRYLSEYREVMMPTLEGKRAAVKDVTVEDLVAFSTNLWKTGYLTSFVAGNVTDKDALKMTAMFPEIVKYTPMDRMKVARYPKAEIPLGELLLEAKIENEGDKNNCLLTVFDIGVIEKNHKKKMTAMLYHQCTKELAFDFLRTKNQIGYLVWSYFNKMSEIGYFSYMMQTNSFSVEAVEELLDEFLHKVVPKHFEEMKEDSFEGFRDALYKTRLEKFKNVYSEISTHWGEIDKNQFVFDRKQKEAEFVKELTKKDVLEFYDTYLKRGAAKRRMITTHLLGHAEAEKMKKPKQEGFGSNVPKIPAREKWLKDVKTHPILTGPVPDAQL